MTDKLSQKRTAVALGTFDGLHKGHTAVINKAVIQMNNGLFPTVLLFDEHPAKLLGGHAPTELISDDQRKSILENAGCSVVTVSFSEIRNMSCEEFVSAILKNRLNAGFVTCGFNYRFGEGGTGDTSVLRRLCERYGIETEVADCVYYKDAPVSSTRIRKALTEGNISDANEMLGRCFSYEADVFSGDRRGRTLGFPTVNQYFDEGFTVPKFGVYASYTEIEGKTYPCVTDIGIRPTVGSDRPRSETHIIGFDGDLYGKKVKIFLSDFLRNEIKFSSIDELKEQIKKDSEKAVKKFTERGVTIWE